MLLPDNIHDRNTIIYLSVEAWDRLVVRENTVARQMELVADDYENQAQSARVEPPTRWRMYE